MQLHSLLLAALLLAVLASAWKSDVFVSYWFNVTASKICVFDAPKRCYYVPRVDPDDTSKVLVVVTYVSPYGLYSLQNLY